MLASQRFSPSPEKEDKGTKPFTAEWKCISSMKREMIKKRQALNRKNNKKTTSAPKWTRNIQFLRRGGQRIIKVNPISYNIEPKPATIHPL